MHNAGVGGIILTVMSRIVILEDESLSLLADSLENLEVCNPDTINEAASVPAFGTLNQPQSASSDQFEDEESSETHTRWNETLNQDVQNQTTSLENLNSFGTQEFRNQFSNYRDVQRRTNFPGASRILQVKFSNLDEAEVDVPLPVSILENGNINKQSESESRVRSDESTSGKDTKEIQDCQYSEERDNGDGNAACLTTRRVAVTGAGGFIATWIVKLLLQRGFYVRGTLRNTDAGNTAHLKSLEGANERLELMRADILHLPSLLGVVEGCEGVFHTACPVISPLIDPEAQILRPAVEGTLNVLRACTQASVKRIVMTSSIGAVYMNPNFPGNQVYDESCWSDENYLKDTKEWYCLAKLMAEKMAWEYAMTQKINLVTICPGITLGTMLQPRVNQSSTHILKYLNGSTKTYSNLWQAYVDVEDVAKAHILAFETPTASGRYLCCKWSQHRGEVVEALACMYPHYPIPTRCKDEGQPRKDPLRFWSKKVEQLGLQFTSFDETLRKVVTSMQAKGILQKQTHTHYLDNIQANSRHPTSISSLQFQRQ